MHLAYLDDSGTDRKNQILVFGGVVIDDRRFRYMELSVGWSATKLIPDERLQTFKRFHASDLYNGTNEFEGIPQERRYEALRELVGLPHKLDAPYVYSAVYKEAVARSAFGSAPPIDVGFRMCACAVHDWIEGDARRKHDDLEGEDIRQSMLPEPLCLMVVDGGDEWVQDRLHQSFLYLRRRVRFSHLDRISENRLFHLHDDLYFGNSKYSVGLQVADACNFVMLQMLRGEPVNEFSALLLGNEVVCAKTEPDWTSNRHVFRTHER